jgi:hypothetical protein
MTAGIQRLAMNGYRTCETLEYYVKGEYTDNYGNIFRSVYTNGPEWTDSLTLLIPVEGGVGIRWT